MEKEYQGGVKNRRKRVIVRLEKQLENPHHKLSDTNKKRIEKEIETLKTRI